MGDLTEERTFLTSFKEKLTGNEKISEKELLEMCTYFEDTIELASVSIKMVDRLRINYLNLKNSFVKN